MSQKSISFMDLTSIKNLANKLTLFSGLVPLNGTDQLNNSS
ncbi:hypothetical protein N6G94_04850 [Pediococcus inopinatus]|nr:hypothetical protein [Pediococcus inopinatus]WPC18327.1 hypothetical protein N6G94_04850 [Pediococcus inopinatus]